MWHAAVGTTDDNLWQASQLWSCECFHSVVGIQGFACWSWRASPWSPCHSSLFASWDEGICASKMGIILQCLKNWQVVSVSCKRIQCATPEAMIWWSFSSFCSWCWLHCCYCTVCGEPFSIGAKELLLCSLYWFRIVWGIRQNHQNHQILPKSNSWIIEKWSVWSVSWMLLVMLLMHLVHLVLRLYFQLLGTSWSAASRGCGLDAALGWRGSVSVDAIELLSRSNHWTYPGGLVGFERGTNWFIGGYYYDKWW